MMPPERDTIYLLDGSSYIHRAYHAIRNLSNSKGQPTNAIFGFTKMLLKLLQEKNPTYMAVVFDAKGPTFRHRLYEEYKANRPPMPEEMAVQLTYIRAVVQGLNILILEKEGYEADDIIGTLVRMGEEKDYKVIMVTGDKDFRQLISPRTSMWDSMKDQMTDYLTFKETCGIEPGQMIDVMGLAGDATDNIPGVQGVGEKTALDLIKVHGTLEGVYDELEGISRKKLKENLETDRDKALLSKKLVTIEQSVPLDVSLADLRVGDPDKVNLTKIFRELEFRELWDQFAARKREKNRNDCLCLQIKDLKDLLIRIKNQGFVSLDTETTSPEPLRAELVGVSFSLNDAESFYLPLGHHYLGAPEQIHLGEALEILRPILEDARIKKIGQNLKYDALVLKQYGIELRGLYFDTMIASYVINPGLRQHNLEYLAQHYLNYKMITYKEVVGRGKNEICFSGVEAERAMEYSCEDADITLRLKAILQEKLESDKNEDLFYDLEMRLLPVLIDMEWTGVRIDTAFLKAMSDRLSAELKRIEREIYDEAGMTFNINSSQQLGYVLFEKLSLPVQKKTTKTRAYSTDVRVLQQLAAMPFKIPKLLLRYRTLSKLKSTYLESLVKMVHPRTSRVHTSYNQTVTATGRLSSSNPNLQNIPIRGEEGREIRKGFIAADGHLLLSADYSQVELRIFAHYADDPILINAFKKGEDIHSRTASEILGVDSGSLTSDMRRMAKAINFGIIYGMGPKKLSEELGLDTATAKKYIESYYERYQGVKKFRQETIEKARQDGYVTTLFNRRRYVPDINHDKQYLRAEAERMAVNTPIQGTAADLIKMAMINIHQRLNREGYKTKMLMQVHDELVFEAPVDEAEEVAAMIRQEMESVHTLKVPLKVDLNMGRNWDEAH